MALTRTHHTHLTSNHPTHHSSHTTSSHSTQHSTTHHTTSGPRLAAAWQAQYTEPPRVAGAVRRASWMCCCARCRRWAAAGCRVAGAVRRASWMSSGLPLTPSFTHHFVKHHLSHTIFDTHTHTPSFTHRHRPSFTHHLSRTTLSHTIFDTPSLSHTIFRHTIFHTRNFVTHHLSSTSSFVFPSFPVPATTLLAHSWKKLTCGVLRCFYFSRACVCVCVWENHVLQKTGLLYYACTLGIAVFYVQNVRPTF